MFTSLNAKQAPAADCETLFDRGVICLCSRQYAEGYFYFNQCLKEYSERPAVYYNIAVCCLACGEYDNALGVLEQGYNIVLSSESGFESSPDATFKKLIGVQNGMEESYPAVMLPDFHVLFNSETKLRFQRMMADCYAGQGNRIKWGRIAALLEKYKYPNIEKVRLDMAGE